MRRLVLVVLALTFRPSAGTAQTWALELSALDGSSRTLAGADLEGMAGESLSVLEEGVPVTYRGPPLRELATLAGAPTGRGLRGPAMTLALLAEGADGYAVGFMVSELDVQFGARRAIVALTRNGAPLPEGDGPARVILPDDEFHARWVRGVVRLRLVDAGALRPAPGAR